MSEQNFHILSESTLLNLADQIEKLDINSIFDVEYSDGILTILLEKTNKQYVVNKHSASQKIWYSSPLSGADYFSYDNNSLKWLNSKKEELEMKLMSELKQFI